MNRNRQGIKGIPPEVNLVEMCAYDARYFSPKVFMGQAQINGGFDAFTDQVIADFGAGQRHSFAPVTVPIGPILTIANMGRQLVGSILQKVGMDSLRASVGRDAATVLGLIFGIGEDTTGKALQGIQDTLGHVQEQLRDIDGKLDIVIGSTVDKLSANVDELKWDTAIREISGTDGPATKIKGVFEMLRQKAESAATNTGTNELAQLRRDAEALMPEDGQILNDTTGIRLAVNNMHSAIMGEGEFDPLLRQYARQVRDQLTTRGQQANCPAPC